MEATCKNCNHWEPQEVQQNNLGECDVLGIDNKDTMIALPVLNTGSADKHVLTNAEFGCNQFSAE